MKSAKNNSIKDINNAKNYMRIKRKNSKLLLQAHQMNDIDLYKFLNYTPNHTMVV